MQQAARGINPVVEKRIKATRAEANTVAAAAVRYLAHCDRTLKTEDNTATTFSSNGNSNERSANSRLSAIETAIAADEARLGNLIIRLDWARCGNFIRIPGQLTELIRQTKRRLGRRRRQRAVILTQLFE
jgi:hypothetical protein